MKVEILTPRGVAFKGESGSVILPGVGGELGVLDHHAPMLAALKEGDLRVQDGGHTARYHITGGFAEVGDNQLKILAEKAEMK